MADRNEDELNQFARRIIPEVLRAAHQGTNQAYADAARPTTDLTCRPCPNTSIGQVMQMLMLATVVEGRLLGINPYGQPASRRTRRT